MLNKYLWELYKRSGGDEVIELFRTNLNDILSDEYIERIKELHGYYCADKGIVEACNKQLYSLRNIMLDSPPEECQGDADLYIDGETNIQSCFKEVYNEWIETEKTDKSVLDMFSWNMAPISTELAFEYPGLYVPYYFYCNYNILTAISDTFDITLPTAPKKADHYARTWHYVELCDALNKFRKENSMSMYELCAFLYDFAPKYIGGIKSYIIEDLPEPKGAYFIGGGGNNDDSIAEEHPNDTIRWQSNPEIKAGDMIVMYLTTPISAVSSIWRSRSVGFIDPFFWYYRCSFLGDPVKVKRIPLAKIKKDKILGKMPIVAKNMQGINGVELRPSEYNHIVEITDVDVPRLEYVVDGVEGSCVNEKEVEEKLIKPLLSRLGYTENEYEQQHRAEVGNHNTILIPDFVLLPISSKGHYSGYATVEAKRSIINQKMMENTKTQARSYANLVSARYSVIASQEGLWVTGRKDDFTGEIFSATWNDLKDNDVFYELSKILGK